MSQGKGDAGWMSVQPKLSRAKAPVRAASFTIITAAQFPRSRLFHEVRDSHRQK
jgi:hypothetical protein